MERTFVMLKPDAVARGLCGKIISRFERAGLKIAAMKMLVPDKALVSKHYPSDEKWLSAVGGKTLDGYKQYGLDAEKELGTTDPAAIGRMVKGWLVDFICSGPVVAMALEGNHAVENVRKIVGNTVPTLAEAGTIRGDFSADSQDAANKEKRPVKNLVHASGTLEEAEFEIGLWFGED